MGYPLAVFCLNQIVFVRDRNDRQRRKGALAPHRGLKRGFVFTIAIVGDKQQSLRLHETPDFLVRQVVRKTIIAQPCEAKLNQLIPTCFFQSLLDKDAVSCQVMIQQYRDFHCVFARRSFWLRVSARDIGVTAPAITRTNTACVRAAAFPIRRARRLRVAECGLIPTRQLPDAVRHKRRRRLPAPASTA